MTADMNGIRRGSMTLPPMRYKNYVWPHNPKVYAIEFRRPVAAHKVPFGRYVLQNMGLSYRVLKGEGEFFGEGAYNEFKKLAALFYEESPGLLQHPVWQDANAYFVSLNVNNEPAEDFVSYSFEFWECYDGYESKIKTLTGVAPQPSVTAGLREEARYYTVVSGDCLWNIAVKNGMSLNELLALNPQFKNPNLIYPGDVVRLS
jgi:LysM repeat protein